MKHKIFNPRYQIDVFVDWLGYEFEESNYEATQDIDQAMAEEFRIAAVPVMFDQFEAYKTNPFDYSQFDLLLISDVEVNHPGPVLEWIKQLGIKNYLFAYGAPFTDAPAEWIYRPWWSFNIVTQNQFKDIELKDPAYEFDILLGAIRPHRNFVMAKLQNSALLDRVIVNYRNSFNVLEAILNDPRDQSLIAETAKILQGQPLLHPYVSPNLDPAWEVKENITNNVSDIVPWKIYEHTKYSVLCETQHRETYITEKMGKALFAKRIFVVFSSYRYLDTLKQLGFRTFNGIIDESYDNEPDYTKRFNLAFEQLEWLAKQDYTTILNQSTDILEYNHNHLIKYRQEIKDTMSKAVYNKIKEIKNANSIQ